MAQPSSSKVTLDMRTPATSDVNDTLIDTTLSREATSVNAEEDLDYSSDGIFTPPLPALDTLPFNHNELMNGLSVSLDPHSQTDVPALSLISTAPSTLHDSLVGPRRRTSSGSSHSPLQYAIEIDNDNRGSDEEWIEITKPRSKAKASLGRSEMLAPAKKRRGRPPGSTKKHQLLKTQRAALGVEASIRQRTGTNSRSSKEKQLANAEESNFWESRSESFKASKPDDEEAALLAQADEMASRILLRLDQAEMKEGETSLDIVPSISPEQSLLDLEPSASPERALLPDFVFQPADDAMFEQLRDYLDQEDARNMYSSSEAEEEEGLLTEEDYERRRLRKLRVNEAILSRLGLGAQTESSPIRAVDEREQEEDVPLASPAGYRKKTYKPSRTLKVDADGTTTSLPLPGSTHEVAYVDVPSLRPRIRLQHIFFDDVEVMVPTPIEIDSPSDTEEEMVPRKRTKQKKTVSCRRGPNGEAMEGEGTTCHQCRRKTLEPKMRCRYHENGRVCPLYFCQRCLDIRYGIEWDEESRTFHCPRCMAFCNCSICLHKAGLSKFVPDSINSGLSANLHDSNGSKIYNSVRHYIEAKVGRAIKIGPGGLLSRGYVKEVIMKRKRKGKATNTAVTQEEEVKVTTDDGKRKRRKSAKMLEAEAEEEAIIHPFVKQKRGVKSQQKGESGLARKIKLTMRTRNVISSQKSRKVRMPKKVKPVSKVIASAAKAIKKSRRQNQSREEHPTNSPQDLEIANVWVKSKADEIRPSSSDYESDESTLTSISSESSDEDDEAAQDEAIEPSATNSPEAGQIEISHQPYLSITQDQSDSIHSPFRFDANLPFPTAEEHLDEDVKIPSEQDFSTLVNQLREAGYV